MDSDGSNRRRMDTADVEEKTKPTGRFQMWLTPRAQNRENSERKRRVRVGVYIGRLDQWQVLSALGGKR